MANLEQGFKQDMVLVIVGNQHVVNRFRKIEVGVAGDTVFVGVAQNGIKQYAHATRFNENAGVSEIPPAFSRPCIHANKAVEPQR